MAKSFTATKTRSNRPGWSITFRHPLRYDTQGRLGLKVRRGLGTDDEEQADALIAQMNTLLRDPTWWNATRRAEAERQFAPPIVRAFFDDLQAGTIDPAALRERHLEMPGRERGYARVLFVGTTGAGKTTLLRQLIGSDPETDRFPSTAPAKTTVADIEVIAGGEDYRAIVTFSTEFQVQAYVEECITEAALAANGGQSESRVAERFLNHRDQKFRLSYILGSWGAGAQPEAVLMDDEDTDEDTDEAALLIPDDEAVSDADRRVNRDVLTTIVGRIQRLAKQVSTEISEVLGVVEAPVSKEDQDAYLELLGEEFEKEIHGQDEFHFLVQDVLDLIRARFDLLETGEISTAPSGWPQSWTFRTEDRSEFIRSIRWFSSNHWPQFGRLLTPIVNGIRLRGPLYPELGTRAKLVLIDGQGLGHTPDDGTSLTTHISNKFAEVDVVLLVDNAQQPMQAAPLSVLRALAISGHEEKLAIAFTHFDQIKGQNLPTMSDRRAHVMASVMSALASLQDSVGIRIVRGLERGVDDRCFMLSGTQKSLKGLGPKAAAYMSGQLTGLIAFFEKASEPAAPPARAALLYDPVGISFAVQNGASKFNRLWNARLGMSSYAATRKEHWTRVKALNKRIAGGLDIEYDTLRPVADLQTSLLEAISRYVDAPVSEPEEGSDQQATTRARQIVAARLNEIVRRRLLEEPLELWRSAYNERGAGSTTRRAMRIAQICEAAAPVPGAVMKSEAKDFLKEVTAIVFSAVTAVGGRFDMPSGEMNG